MKKVLEAGFAAINSYSWCGGGLGCVAVAHSPHRHCPRPSAGTWTSSSRPAARTTSGAWAAISAGEGLSDTCCLAGPCVCVCREDTWINFYNYDPLPNTTTPAQEALLWGGEASQWGEQVDATNIHSRMWPRACAQAERLWSPASINDADAAMPRLAYHRCRMVQRGIGAGPIRPSANFGFCKLPPGSPFL